MKTSKQVRAGRLFRVIALAVAAFVLGMAPDVIAARGLNKLQGISSTKSGAVTKIYLQMETKPTFTVYRLERPTRVIVDLANTTVKGYEDPVDVDSWAVRQVAVAKFSHTNSSITRVLIGFKRDSSYSVKAQENRVVVTVTAHSNPPKDRAEEKAKKVAQRAEAEAIEARKLVAEAKKETQKVKEETRKAKSEAERFRSKIQLARKKLQEAEEKARRLDEESRQTQSKLGQMRSKLEHLRSEAEKAQKKLLYSRTETAKLERRVHSLKGTTQEAQAKLQLARAKARQAKAEKRAAEIEAEKAKAAGQAARQATKNAIQEREAAKAEALKLRRLAKKLKGTASEAHAKLKWAQAAARAARLEVDRTRQKARGLKNRVAHLKDETQSLKKKADAARKRAEKIRTKNAWMAAKTAKARWEEKKRIARIKEAEKVKAELAKTRAEAANVRAELRRLKLEAEEAKKEAAHNRTKATKAKALLSRIGRRVKSARGDEREANAKAEKAAEEYGALREKTLIARKRAKQIQLELHRLKHRRKALRVETAMLAKKVRAAKQVVVQTKKKAAEMERRYQETGKRVKLALSNVREARSRIDLLRKKSETLKGKSSGMRARLAKETETQKKELERARLRLSSERKKLKKVLEKRRLAESARETATVALGELEKKKKKNIRLEQDARTQARNAAKKQSSALKQKQELEKKISELMERHRRLLEVSRGEEKKQQKLKGALIKLQSNVTRLRKALKEEVQRAEKAKRARLKEEHLAERARNARERLQEFNRGLEHQITRLRKLKETLSKEKNEARRAARTGTIKERRKARREWRKLSRTRKREIRELEKKVAGLRESKNKASSTLGSVTEKYEQARKEAKRLNVQLSEARKELESANHRKENAEKHVAVARKQLALTLKRKKKEQQTVRRLEAERRAESRKLHELRSQGKNLKARMKRIKQQLRQEKREMSELGNKRLHVRDKIKAVRAELRRLRERKNREEKVGKKLEQKRKKLERKLAQAGAKLATTRSVKRAQPSEAAKKDRDTRSKITARVESVKFRDTGETHRVVLKVSGKFDYNIQRAKQRKVLLRLYGVAVPGKLERSLDTSAFRGPVEVVSTFKNRRNRGAVDLLMKLKEPARFRVNRQGKFLWVDFVKGSRRQWRERLAAANKKVPPGADVEVSSSRVSGYSARGRSVNPRRRRRDLRTKYSVRGRNLGPRVDMDFKDADLHNVLRLIGQVWRKNIVVPDDVSGRVTIRMVNVRVGRALEVVLRSKSLGLVWEGPRIIRIARMDEIRKELEDIRQAQQIKKKEQPVVMRVLRLSYADADQVAKQLETNALSKRGNVSSNKRTNTIIIRDVIDNIEIARKLVSTLDTPTPQVLIEARIVEARSSFLREVGVQWGGSVLASPATGAPTGLMFPFSIGAAGGSVDDVTQTGGLIGAGATNPAYAVNLPATTGTGQGGALGLSLGTLGNVANINLRLSAMEETGQVRIISAPKITTLDNVEAKIEQGVRIPISVVSAQGVNTMFEEANLGLTVTPHVTADGRVRLKMSVTKNEPDFVNTGARGDPTILKKSAQSEMLIPDGDTAVIGGIYSRTTAVAYSKVPWIADIPVIGWLFKKKRQSDERSEVLIFITPRVIKQGKVEEKEVGR